MTLSLTHLDVSDDALILKKVDLDWHAIHFPVNTEALTSVALYSLFTGCPFVSAFNINFCC